VPAVEPLCSGLSACSLVTVLTELPGSNAFRALLVTLWCPHVAISEAVSRAKRAALIVQSIQTGRGAQPSYCSLGAEGLIGRGVKLTPHDRLVPRLRINAVIPALPHMTSWQAEGLYFGKEITAKMSFSCDLTPCRNSCLTLQYGSRFLQPVLRHSDYSSSSMVLVAVLPVKPLVSSSALRVGRFRPTRTPQVHVCAFNTSLILTCTGSPAVLNMASSVTDLRFSCL
jgi:hypothetical protein